MESKALNFISNNKNLHNFFIDDYESVAEIMSLFAIEIAKEAFDEGFSYAVASHVGMKQTYLNKEQYIEKLKNEL